MNVLVAYASRHGATEEIARDIAQRLTSRGHLVTAEPVSSDPDPEQYEAVVVGSAVYIEHWDKRALEFVHRHAVALASRPTWLFSSGPKGTAAPSPPIPNEKPKNSPLTSPIRPGSSSCA